MATNTIYKTNTIGAPLDGDTLNFEGGGVNVDTGLDQSALTEGLTNINVLRSFFGNIGSPSTSLKADLDFAASSTLWYDAGGGAMWYTPNGDNNLANKIRATSIAGTLTLNGTGTVTQLEVGRGTVIIGGNITVTTLYIAGGQVIHQAGTAPTTVIITGGSYQTFRGGTTITQHGGLVDMDTTTAITTYNMAGGRHILRRSGTITNYNLFAGDARNVEISRAITMTNSTVWASVGNASAFMQNPMITFTNATTKIIADGNNY